jgi:hypothetical protein
VADKVVLGLGHAVVDELAEVVEQTLAGTRRLARSGAAVGADGILRGEELEVLEGNAEDRVDDLRSAIISVPTCIRRDGKSKLFNEVNRGAHGNHGVEALIDRLLDVRQERLDVLGSEKGLDHGPGVSIDAFAVLPLLHVLGGVHVDKRRRSLGSLLAAGAELGESGTGADLGEALVRGNLGDILVLGDEPGVTAVEELDLGDGVRGAELGKLGRRLHAGSALEGELGSVGHGGGGEQASGGEYASARKRARKNARKRHDGGFGVYITCCQLCIYMRKGSGARNMTLNNT